MKNETTFSSDGQVRRTEIDNGIRIVTERMPFVRSVALGVWVHAGSGDESSENNGIAHFLEHMLFKGTTTRTAKIIARSLESLGGGLDASTGKEVSFYAANVLSENIDTAVDVLADMLHNPLFDKNDIELEKQVVLAEMASAQDDPEEMVVDHFYKNIFPRHPLGYFIYGVEENIRRFTRHDLQSFKNARYRPNQTVVSAAGNIDHDRFVDLIEQSQFSDNAGKGANLTRAALPNVTQRAKVRNRGAQQAHVCFGARTFGYGDQRKYALILLDVILGGGMGARLFQNIREKYGYTYSIYSFAELLSHTGVFGACLACDKKNVEKSIQHLQIEFDKIKNGDISEEELEQAKAQLKGNIIMGLESSSRRMRRIGESEIFKAKHYSLDEIINLICAVEKKEIEELVRELFVSNNTSITILSP